LRCLCRRWLLFLGRCFGGRFRGRCFHDGHLCGGCLHARIGGRVERIHYDRSKDDRPQTKYDNYKDAQEPV
jgi:hypothetical protein